MSVATVVTGGYGSFGSVAFVVGLGYGPFANAGTAVSPSPVVQGPAGGAPAFPRRAEYRNTLEFYKRELRKQEKQTELQQLEELSKFYQQRLAEPEPEAIEQPSFALIRNGIDALVESIEQYRTEKSFAAQIAQQIAELVQQIDDEESLIMLLS